MPPITAFNVYSNLSNSIFYPSFAKIITSFDPHLQDMSGRRLQRKNFLYSKTYNFSSCKTYWKRLKTSWKRVGRQEIVMTSKNLFLLIRIKDIVITILKMDHNLESWIAIITFLLYFDAEDNQGRFSVFYLLLGACIQ